MKYFSLKNSQGLTLLELLITMAIIIILAMVAVPSYNTFMANERFAVASNELNNAYRFARNEALKTSHSMILKATTTVTTADGKEKWLGWQVLSSSTSTTPLLVSRIPHESITIIASGAGDTVTVKGRGSLVSSISFTISGASKTSLLCIYASGQSVFRYPEKGESCS
ncbi:MAG: type IV fimbrial biogenesis protein FimT [Psychromonas sp.]|jgi:type IV fimbrial biogenesis protein FimT|uniref:GspH/FimT family pseudopilin n=1 Tax=Psychromonas sp. TaxID=1884585 RepID=UPI0039E6D7D6